jgi:hypothetical protein
MFMDAIVEKLGGSDILKITPMEFWLTVPAIWSDEAKAATRAAAKAAGFGSRPGDEINLIPEPEAAAHLALKSSIHHTSDLVKVTDSASCSMFVISLTYFRSKVLASWSATAVVAQL